VKALIVSYYDYTEWASVRLLDLCDGLTREEVTRRFSAGALPILDTFVHLASVDARWLARWAGAPLPPPRSAADLPTIAAVRAAWAAIRAAQRAYVAGLDDAALAEAIRWERPAGDVMIPRWQVVFHCANHAMQHRSEIAMMLSDLGRSPGDMDYTVFVNRTRAR
jgi:uncharacterized damage-inducible protein DinB